jgi:hypothetical protein
VEVLAVPTSNTKAAPAPVGGNVAESPLKPGLTVAGLILVIAACWVWIYFTQLAPRTFNAPLHEGVGTVLAEETANLLDHKGQIVLITVHSREFPELRVQLASFEKTLKSSGAISIQQIEEVEAKDPKYGVGRGLSATRLLKTVTKHPNADAIVSLIGVPNFTPAELDEFSKAHLKFIAEVRSQERTLRLLDQGILQLAVVSRFIFPAPGGTKHPRKPREWFDRYFQVVTPASGSTTH